MSWFRSKRKVATEAATLALRPLLSLAGMSGGMSNFMWHDPYLLGFMNFTASFYAKAETKGKVGPEDLGYAMFDAFTNVSNMNGKFITERAVNFAESRNHDFERGLKDASAVAFISAGFIDQSEPDALIARSIGSADALMTSGLGADRRGALAGAMIQNSFVERVKELRKDENA